jgi:hypothetical protein
MGGDRERKLDLVPGVDMRIVVLDYVVPLLESHGNPWRVDFDFASGTFGHGV